MSNSATKRDCHRNPDLDKFLGVRAIIETTKGTCKGRLVYLDGWYYCQAPQLLSEDGRWKFSPNRFLFRKSQFRHIEQVPNENANGE